MNLVVLRRRNGAGVEVHERAGDGTTVGVMRVGAEELAEFVRERERTGVRWVWDDTTRWYHALLDAGVRVERCTDLRLTHAVLRRSPFVDQSLLADDETSGWDALQPVTATDAALFPSKAHLSSRYVLPEGEEIRASIWSLQASRIVVRADDVEPALP